MRIFSGVQCKGESFKGSTVLEFQIRWCSCYIEYHLVVTWKALLLLCNFLLGWVKIFLGG